MPWPSTPLRPVLLLFIRIFLGQDRDALGRQSEGLKYEPPLMLVGDADIQARWYYRLKREYSAARAEKPAVRKPGRENAPCGAGGELKLRET